MNSFRLRRYQEDGVHQLRLAYMRGKRAPLFVLPTGGGKTAVFSYIAQSAAARGRKITILVHRHELLMQASRSLERLSVSHGVISPKFIQSSSPVQVASVQTLVRRLDKVSAPDLIVIDEAHHATAGTYKKIFEAFPSSQLLGVTATPIRTDGRGFEDVFDEIVVGPSISELIEQNHLVKPVVYAPPIGIDLTGVKKKMGDYDKSELNNRIDKPSITGSAVEHYSRLCRGEPAIAFCVSVAHAKHVADQFRCSGFRAASVDGSMRDSDRQAAIDGLANGNYQVLTSADLIGEGLDIPKVAAAILLRPTHSLALYLQQVGRALRPYPGKTEAIILDHVGNVVRHGFPDDDRDWSLEGTKGNSKKKSHDKIVRVSQCEQCYFVYETGPEKCPSCGHANPVKERKIEEKTGELKKLEREQIEAARRQHRREQGQARTLEELQELAKKTGKSPGWAWHVWNSRAKRRA